MKLIDAVKVMDYKITHSEHVLVSATKRISKLKNQKDGIFKLIEKFPDGQYSGGSIYLDGIEDWNKIAGMSIEKIYVHGRGGPGSIKCKIKFSLNKKDSEGIKVFMVPDKNLIAEIDNQNKTLLINDYKTIIPENCPRRKAFIKKIKRFIVGQISVRKLTILDTSFDKEEFLKLMLLK